MYCLFGIDAAGIGGLSATGAFIITLLSILIVKVNKWHKRADEEQDLDQRIITTLFGKDAVPPYPAIDGLVKGHENITNSVHELNKKVATLESNVTTIGFQIETLIERTQENGGSSIKDQLNNIEGYIKARQVIDKIGK